jgi:formylglycine-generating enzyme required for sulfatase activity
MIGNLWEWCRDHWDRGFYTRSSTTDPVASRFSGRNRVIRGSSYRNTAWLGRSAFRTSGSPEAASLDVGFRPARAIEIHHGTDPGTQR